MKIVDNSQSPINPAQAGIVSFTDKVLQCVANFFTKTQAAVGSGIVGAEALDEEYSNMFWNTAKIPFGGAPPGNYNQRSNTQDLTSVDQQTINEELQVKIDVTKLGQVPNFFPAVVDFNGFTLMPRSFDEASGLEIISSDSARIYVRFNSVNNPWIPFGLGGNSNPLQADMSGIARPIRRVWIIVTHLTQDPTRFPYLVVSFLKNISLNQGGGAPSLYSVPSGSANLQSSSGHIPGVTGGGIGTGGGGTSVGGTGSGGSGIPGGRGRVGGKFGVQ